ncbi:glycosyltransferase family 4 protein [Clostridium perfringens]|uniref:glycosyltransferase family 4 protein n=1 Tax=Clostridium perfringens TaxID=1502 RepID=UPI0006C2BF8B|nr:glycosyltransferase family 4 protein [Clostridium perfringens]EHK2335418.1 glycosyltransferase family 4 protein [Clostridium perfringens]MBI6054808.1 glycosyltransferase family 4 protein [Clostridium perfringens]MBO3325694.1 glycosyltransferase family 4 protein [Clostridium perfringens]TBX07414.1 glycosyl transferase [Clostridium perfringens]CUO81330.1 hexosyltransferase [Clostridium perfringens]
MKKVLILVNHDVVIYNFRKELVDRLLKDNYNVYISSPYGERIDELVGMGCKYIEAKISRHGTNIVEELKLIHYYKKIIKSINPDIVLSYTIKPNIYGGIACRILKVPYIANITGLGTAVENYGMMQNLTTFLYKIAFKKIKCVFFQNTENMQFFTNKNIAIGKHRLVPGSGVNLEYFNVLEYPSDEIVEFVFISRIMKEKGIDYYIEAAKFIRNKYENTRFHICGFCEEEYEDKLKILQNQGIIIYHGMQRDIRKILAKTHCTIHPTYYPEGMSNVLLESSACGRPIITTNRSGCKEIVDTKVNGFIIEQKNSKDLINKIEEFLKLSYEEKKQMGLNGRKKVEKEFDRQIVVDAYIDEINNCGRNLN